MTSGKSLHNRLRFIIIGGGITGLACALGLRQTGHYVVLLDKKRSISKVRPTPGVGCRLPPNLTKALYDLGLRVAVEKLSLECNNIHMLQLESGEHLGTYFWDDELLSETGGDSVFVEHAKLWDLLYRTAICTGAEYRLGAEAVEISPQQGFVTLSSGEVLSGDVIVGADGLEGVSLEYVDPSDVPLCESGIEYTCTIAPKKAVASHVSSCPSERDMADMFIWMGDQRAMLGFPTLCTPDSNDDDFDDLSDDEFDDRKGSVEFSISVYSFTEQNSKSRRANATVNNRRNISIRGVLPEWVRGKLVILGPAAHPLPVGSLQSAALAVEDGMVLSRLFSHMTSETQIDLLLNAFQAIRKPRCDEVHTKEFGILYYMTMADEQDQDRRNRWIRSRRDDLSYITSDSWDSDFEGTVEENEIRDVFGYDATEVADRWWSEWGNCLHDDNFGWRKPIVVHVETTVTVTYSPLRI